VQRDDEDENAGHGSRKFLRCRLFYPRIASNRFLARELDNLALMQ
jgi:hypothetical protein